MTMDIIFSNDEKAPESTHLALDLPHAGFWTRLVASLIDSIAFGLPMALFTVPLTFFPEQALAAGAVQLVVNLVFSVLLPTFLICRYGGTPGKMALDLEIVDVNTGNYISPWRAFGRLTVGMMISGLLLGLGFLMVAFRSDKRGLHDLIFRTVVVKRAE